MESTINKYISQTLNLSEQAVANTLKLLAEGATIPFISRYRKEATGGLDEVQIAAIDTAYKKLQVDHKDPWSKGGRTTLANAQLLCEHHNKAKGNRN